ncbi:MAG: methyltransferase domain-containing protein [Bryobacteraceae bacterium]|nr:methyltransferase domain-containing protein [Bryobacteraceae bacterium]
MVEPLPVDTRAQDLSVKRAQVDFHKFASLGQPERVLAAYADENTRRAAILEDNLDFVPSLEPFLEIGANAGHTSYMLVNRFGAQGYALDISFDALRYGQYLRTAWNLGRSPVLVAGDATRLPFRSGSLAFVMGFQMLSQFMDIDAVLREVHRVLAPGGVYFFAEEPIRRVLSLRLYRAPYPDRMNPVERLLYRWGLLDYIAADVIGAWQEESFGIRQNHRYGLRDWLGIIGRYFPEGRVLTFPRASGWANQAVLQALRLFPGYTDARAARFLGGTLAALCRKPGSLPETLPLQDCLACPDCLAPLPWNAAELRCSACGFAAALEDGVFNLLPSKLREELYPGARPDNLDFSKPGHEQGLLEGFYELEGEFGNRYRWMGPRARLRLVRTREGRAVLRLQGYSPSLARIDLRANGAPLGTWRLERTGLFVLEAPLPLAREYIIDIAASPVFKAEGDLRTLSVNISLARLQYG